MAGVKRKLDANQGSASASSGNAAAEASQNTLNNSTEDTSRTRVTRSHRTTRASQSGQGGQGGQGSQSSQSNRSGPSRIITLSTRNARANTARAEAEARAKAEVEAQAQAQAQANAQTTNTRSSGRETRTSRGRAAPPPPTQQPEPPAPPVPETPRVKRVKRGTAVEETPRTTRQSARLRSQGNPGSDMAAAVEGLKNKQLEASPSTGAVSGVRTRNRDAKMADSTSNSFRDPEPAPDAAVKSPSPDGTVSATAENSTPAEADDSQDTNAESKPAKEALKNEFSDKSQNQADEHATSIEFPQRPTNTPSPRGSRRRKSSATEVDHVSEAVESSISPSKKPKLEKDEADDELEQQLQNGTDGKPESHSPVEATGESGAGDESRQITEEVDDAFTPDNAAESVSAGKGRGGRGGVTRGRGRGRGGRSRGAARAPAAKRGGTGRGRGGRNTRGRTSGRHHDRSSDFEYERSPSPSAATQKLRERQRDLDKAFKKVAAAQRLALAVLATQSERKLARDRNAHKNVPEYDEINEQLKARLAAKKKTLRHEYELKVAQENRVFAANKASIEERFQASARNIQDEHLLAAQGDYMAFVEGRRAAEDDEHTETDGSETETDHILTSKLKKEFVRGFNSTCVRNLSGAAAYERASIGWEDFTQRAKLGGDLSPQMKEMGQGGIFAGLAAPDIISLLLQATGILEVQQNEKPSTSTSAPTPRMPVAVAPVPEPHPTALFALADAAASTAASANVDNGVVLPRTAPPHPPLPPVRTTPTHRTLLPQLPQPSQVAHGATDPRSFMLPRPTPQRQRRLLPAGPHEPLGLPDPFVPRGGGPPQLPPPPGSNFQRPPIPGYMSGLYYPPPHPAGPPPPTRPPF